MVRWISFLDIKPILTSFCIATLIKNTAAENDAELQAIRVHLQRREGENLALQVTNSFQAISFFEFRCVHVKNYDMAQ